MGDQTPHLIVTDLDPMWQDAAVALPDGMVWDLPDDLDGLPDN